MSLYKDSRPATIRDAARAWAQSRGMQSPEQIAQAQDVAEQAVYKFVKNRPHVGDAAVRKLTTTVLRIAAANTVGGGTAEVLARLNANGHELVRSGTNSNQSQRALLARANEHLRTCEPELHRALDTAATPELAGIGSHPNVLRIILDEQRQRDAVAERAPTHSKGFHGHQSSKAAEAAAAKVE